jgi:hypothetical protein
MQLYPADGIDAFVGQVRLLWGHILAQIGAQYKHRDPSAKQHPKWFQKASQQYMQAFVSPSARELRSGVIAYCIDELNGANRSSAALALHNLTLAHLQAKSFLESGNNARDVDILLIVGELEAALAKRAASESKTKRWMGVALSRFQAIYNLDPSVLEVDTKRSFRF